MNNSYKGSAKVLCTKKILYDVNFGIPSSPKCARKEKAKAMATNQI